MNTKNTIIDSNNIPLEDIFFREEINNKNNGEKNPKLDEPATSGNNQIKYINRPVMDTSLPYIPVYTHLVTYDLTPIERPPTPPVIKILRAKLRTDTPRSTPESRASSRTGKKF